MRTPGVRRNAARPASPSSLTRLTPPATTNTVPSRPSASRLNWARQSIPPESHSAVSVPSTSFSTLSAGPSSTVLASSASAAAGGVGLGAVAAKSK